MIAVLHNIRSVHNVGSIFRTADAGGIEKIYLCGITPAPIDKYGRIRQDFIKVSLGAEKYVKWEYFKSTSRLINGLKKQKYKILAVEQNKKSIPYYKVKIKDAFLEESRRPNRKLVLVFGNEVSGLPDSILKKSDKILEIPIKGAMVRQAHHPKNLKDKTPRQAQGKESLNVSVAFGIITFHLLNA